MTFVSRLGRETFARSDLRPTSVTETGASAPFSAAKNIRCEMNEFEPIGSLVFQRPCRHGFERPTARFGSHGF